MNKTLVAVLILAIIAVGGYFLLAQNPLVTNPDNVISDLEKNLTTKEIVVTGSNFKFEPKEIRVKSGDNIKLRFVNSDGFHDFVLPEFNVSTPQIQASQEATIEFVASKTGQFEYYCSVGNHRQMGMTGTLIVE